MKNLFVKLVVVAGGFRFPVAGRTRVIWAFLKEIAPYAAIELILPGGTLLAILCWLYRRRHAASPLATSRPVAYRPGSWPIGLGASAQPAAVRCVPALVRERSRL